MIFNNDKNIKKENTNYSLSYYTFTSERCKIFDENNQKCENNFYEIKNKPKNDLSNNKSSKIKKKKN